MAEHLIRNEKVVGSTPTISSRNWSPKPETFFREAVDFTAIHDFHHCAEFLVNVSRRMDTPGYT